MPESYATVNEVCEQLSISRATFYRMLADVDSGLAQVVIRVRGRIRVPVGEFEKWLERARKG